MNISVEASIIKLTHDAYQTWKTKRRSLAKRVYIIGPKNTKSEFKPKFGIGQDSVFNVLSFSVYDSVLIVYNVIKDHEYNYLGIKSYTRTPTSFIISNFKEYSFLFKGEKSTTGYIFQDEAGYAILFGDSVILRVDSPATARFETLSQPTSVIKRRLNFFLLEHVQNG